MPDPDSTLLDLLREQELVPEDELRRAIEEGERTGTRPEKILLEAGAISSVDLLQLVRIKEEDRLARGIEASSGRAVGQRFDRYRVLGEMARGGMGVVYLARDEVLGRKVALKLLKSGLSASDELRRRFVREARAQMDLRHPGIAQIYDAGEAHERPYIAMEFVEGPSLEAVIENQKGLIEPRFAMGILADLARAVHYAHRKGVIHRDLKPSNVILGEDDRPKVIDFGLARFAEPVDRMTRTGQLLGTPFYMAPELLRGREIDGRADVYALGIILHEMVTGERPYRADSFPSLVQAIEGGFPSPADVRPDIPEELDRIARRATRIDPGRRYGTADELADDLEGFLAGDRVRPGTRVPGPLVAGAVGAVLLLLVLGGAWIGLAPGGGPDGAGDGSSPVDAASPDATDSTEGRAVPGERAEDHEAVWERARSLQAEGREDEAIELLDRAVEEGRPGAHLALGRLHARADRLLVARDEFERGIEAGEPEGWFWRGQSFLARDEPEPAAHDLLRFLEETEPGDPRRTKALEHLVGYHINRGELDAAEETLEQALEERELEGADLDSTFLLDAGHEMRDRGDLEAAFRALGMAARVDPDRVETRITRSEVAIETGRPEVARREAEAVLEDHPENVEALIRRSVALMRLGRAREAEETLLEAERLDPDRPAVVRNLAVLQFQAFQDAEKAERWARRHLELFPDHPSSHFFLAGARMLAGRRDEARTHLRRAFELAEGRSWQDRRPAEDLGRVLGVTPGDGR